MLLYILDRVLLTRTIFATFSQDGIYFHVAGRKTHSCRWLEKVEQNLRRHLPLAEESGERQVLSPAITQSLTRLISD